MFERFSARRAGVVWLVLAACSAAASAQAAGQLTAGLFAYTLEHRTAGEAMELVELALSDGGTVELQPGSNTLVVRDRPEVLARVAKLLAELDRPPRDLKLEIQMLRAGPRRVSGSPEAWAKGNPIPEQPPAELIGRLRGLLRYDSYELLAKASLDSREGQEITYSLGDDYGVSFRLGSILAGQRLKLRSFRIVQTPAQGTNKGRRLEPKELIHTNLNLWMDRTFTLVLAQDAKSGEALMVAISCRPAQEAR